MNRYHADDKYLILHKMYYRTSKLVASRVSSGLARTAGARGPTGKSIIKRLLASKV